MNFEESLKSIFDHLETIPKDAPAYSKKLLAFSSLLEKQFPEEFALKLTSLGVKPKMDKWLQVANEMITEVDMYEIDYRSKTIKVRLDHSVLENALIDLNQYINNFNIQNESDRLLSISYLSRRDHFEVFQVAEAIING